MGECVRIEEKQQRRRGGGSKQQLLEGSEGELERVCEMRKAKKEHKNEHKQFWDVIC